jgi:hypothetical protein
MTLEHATLFFLVIVFLAAEVFRVARGKRGILLSLNEQGYDSVMVSVIKARIGMHDGNVIEADINSCTACIGRLKVGDEVRVTDSGQGFVADLPWFRRQTCNRKRFLPFGL